MDNFHLLDLPLTVQDIIVEKMVENLPIQDCLEFSKTSEYCLWLIQRVKTKKIVNFAVISFSSTNVSFYLDGKNFAFDYSIESADDLDKLLSFISFRILKINTKLFDPENAEFFEKFKNSWISAVKNVKKLRIPGIKDYENEFLKFLTLIKTLEELEIYRSIDEQEVILHILSKMKYVKSLNLSGPMNDDFLKLLASKTSQEKPLVKCYVRSYGSIFTIDAQEKFKQDVYWDEKDEIRFQTELKNTTLIFNWKTF